MLKQEYLHLSHEQAMKEETQDHEYTAPYVQYEKCQNENDFQGDFEVDYENECTGRAAAIVAGSSIPLHSNTKSKSSTSSTRQSNSIVAQHTLLHEREHSNQQYSLSHADNNDNNEAKDEHTGHTEQSEHTEHNLSSNSKSYSCHSEGSDHETLFSQEVLRRKI